MAKKKTGAREKIAMISESGYMYTTTKNKRNTEAKLELEKFDPWLRKIVTFKEKKIPK